MNYKKLKLIKESIILAINIYTFKVKPTPMKAIGSRGYTGDVGPGEKGHPPFEVEPITGLPLSWGMFQGASRPTL